MSHLRPFGNASLLLLLSSAIASACGGSLSPSTADAGEDGGTGTISSGATADAGDSADAGFDGATAPDDETSADAGQSGFDEWAPPPSIRRPFLVGSNLRAAHAVSRADWLSELESAAAHDVDATTAGWLARVWLKDALEEHASIAAFARFTMHLLAVGAPPDLVAQSQRASLDEIRHARICFALSHRYGGAPSGPSSLVVHDTMGVLSLAELAALTAEEGCIGETLGAVLAREQASVATDTFVAEALRKIARDEARHAELAWRFVAWAVANGGDDVRRAAAAGCERAIAVTLSGEPRIYDGVDPAAWRAHGRLTCAEARAASRRAIDEVVRPAMRAASLDRTTASTAFQRASSVARS